MRDDLSSSPLNDQPLPGQPPTGDLTGRDRMAWNVVASWAGHMVFVVAGFVLPRFTDRQLGQEALGVWDFGWSLVTYFGLAQVGIGSSVNRYVAKYRAERDPEGLNRAIASVTCIQLVAGALVLILTVAAAWSVPWVLSVRLGALVDEARWVVALLGLGLAVQMVLNAYVGVITGCHRWDLHNFINAGSYAVTAVAMIISLSFGGGLRGMAAAHCGGTVAGEIVRVMVAFRVCPELRFGLRNAGRSQAIEMLGFGGKSVLTSLSKLFLYQTNSMIIVAFLGPAALAAFSRSKSLVSHAQTFVNKFAFVVTPTASSLQAAGRMDELRVLTVQTARLATYMSLPIVLTLAILGDPILQIWMGPNYRQGHVLAILALGHLAEMTRQPVMAVLAGMNLHGRPGIANLIAAMGSVALGILFVGPLGLGLPGAALAIAVPLAIVNGVYVPIYACRRLRIGVGAYLRDTNRGPLLCAVPFACGLVLCRAVFPADPVRALAAGALLGVGVLGPLCWCVVFPANLKRAIRGWIAKRATSLILLLRKIAGCFLRQGITPTVGE